ncbi:hypothetical protein Tco_0952256 [Tanacetum coccineum]|uniref:Reverse transcriptase domain-containing protein n=1 Tax=Tanacetum coccineum TaxID=301880 RepID=A0ABQ5DWE2_9ASTR
MSADSAVTYTSVHSEARSWSIPSENPYEVGLPSVVGAAHVLQNGSLQLVRAEIVVLRTRRRLALRVREPLWRLEHGVDTLEDTWLAVPRLWSMIVIYYVVAAANGFEAEAKAGLESATTAIGSGPRPAQTARECSYSEFLKCKPLDFKGTEGVVRLTRWFEKMESVFSISNCPAASQSKLAIALCKMMLLHCVIMPMLRTHYLLKQLMP